MRPMRSSNGVCRGPLLRAAHSHYARGGPRPTAAGAPGDRIGTPRCPRFAAGCQSAWRRWNRRSGVCASFLYGFVAPCARDCFVAHRSVRPNVRTSPRVERGPPPLARAQYDHSAIRSVISGGQGDQPCSSSAQAGHLAAAAARFHGEPVGAEHGPGNLHDIARLGIEIIARHQLCPYLVIVECEDIAAVSRSGREFDVSGDVVELRWKALRDRKSVV